MTSATPFRALRRRLAEQIRPWLIFSPGWQLERKRPPLRSRSWLLAQKRWIVPIPGTTKLDRLEEDLGAVNVQLTREDLGEIESAASKITVQGARYPEHLERLSYR
jgi:hypothetical protein